MLYITSDRLRVEIPSPGEAPNTTRRFDRAGFISEVILDGQHRFCASEPNNLSHPSTGGRGLCCEYAWAGAGQKGVFFKPGIGLLEKEAGAPYRHFGRFAEKQLLEIHVEAREDQATFVTEPLPFEGTALRQERTLRVRGNTLTIHTRLVNEGEKPFVAEEYNHNFLTINGMALGPGYELAIPSLRDMGSAVLRGVLQGQGHGLTFSRYVPEAQFMPWQRDDFVLEGPFAWSMSHAGAKAAIQVTDEIRFSRATLWAVDHMLSMESFHAIDLAPGQEDQWTRSYTFVSLP